MARRELGPAALKVAQAVAAVLPGDAVVGCSGGADSLALALGAHWAAERIGARVVAVVVDHGLQDGSAEVAARVAGELGERGIAAEVARVRVDVADGGLEAAARDARLAALTSRGLPVLLGHTLDDQAETVLLGLARGSGGKSLHGMAAVNGPLVRPLLGIRRDETHQACADQGLEPWHDPQNDDEQFKRVRIRTTVMPMLERELGPGIAQALARTATTLREDAETLDALALEWANEIIDQDAAGRITLDVGGLVTQPAALRQRICRIVAEQGFGVSLSRAHTMAVSALATEWRGQGPIDLPGIRVERADGQLFFGANRPDAESDAEPDLAPDVRPDADETIDRRDGRGD